MPSRKTSRRTLMKIRILRDEIKFKALIRSACGYPWYHPNWKQKLPALMPVTCATRGPTLPSGHGLRSVPYPAYHHGHALSRWLALPVLRLFGRIKSPSSPISLFYCCSILFVSLLMFVKKQRCDLFFKPNIFVVDLYYHILFPDAREKIIFLIAIPYEALLKILRKVRK